MSDEAIRWSVAAIRQHLGDAARVEGNEDLEIRTVRTPDEADESSLIWIREDRPDREALIRATSASVVICDLDVPVADDVLARKCIIRVARPQLAFIRLMNDLIAPAAPKSGIHESAIVHPEARIASGVYIGPFAVVGKCSIGEGAVVESHAVIHEGATVGRRVLIREHCSVGGQGFGHILNSAGRLENVSHIGSTVIGDDAELFPYVNVDRGTLSPTVVGPGAKIDHYCHIGHNTSVGAHAAITAGVIMCGGSSVGEYAWIGVGSIIRDSVRVGKHAFVGMGSAVTRNVPDGETWLGIPARPRDEYTALQKRLRALTQ